VATIAGQLARLTAGRGGLATAAPLAAVRGVAGGDARAVAGLTDGMREFYQLAIAPHQRLVDAVAHRDRAARMDALADGGVETLLAGLHPRTVWSDGALRVLDHPDQRIELGGRGLLLVPSYFCVRHPVTLYDPSLPPVLVYPVRRAPATVLPARAGLARLVGGTRAAILDAIGTGCGTTDVARRVGVAPASASEHLGVLRAAGLVSSERNRNRMLHRLTRLGLSLLDHEHAGNVEATPGAGSKPRIRNAAR
jgi:DNA-binding transcriptional ArsR family regulator